jgi:hypothetical protein
MSREFYRRSGSYHKRGSTRGRVQGSRAIDGQDRSIERITRRHGRTDCAAGLLEWLEERAASRGEGNEG